ncbi:hypothetical protein Trydic_g6311 [Trypoxylus dichotomus]
MSKSKILSKYWKHSTTQHYYNQFKYYRFEAKRLTLQAYRQYIYTMQNNLCEDPKRVWSCVQSKRGRTRILARIGFNGIECSTPTDIDYAFGEYFSSVYIESQSNH